MASSVASSVCMCVRACTSTPQVGKCHEPAQCKGKRVIPKGKQFYLVLRRPAVAAPRRFSYQQLTRLSRLDLRTRATPIARSLTGEQNLTKGSSVEVMDKYCFLSFKECECRVGLIQFDVAFASFSLLTAYQQCSISVA